MNVYHLHRDRPTPTNDSERMRNVLFHIYALGCWYPVMYAEGDSVMRPSRTKVTGMNSSYALGLPRIR